MTFTPPLPFQRFFHWLALLACSALLAACGGGGGNPGTTTGVGSGGSTGTGGGVVTPVPTVVVSLANAAGQSSNIVTTAAPLTAKALFTDSAGKPVANGIVTFTTDSTLVLLSLSTGTALTDASGVATVTLRPATGSVSGAGKLSVSAQSTAASTPVKTEINYQVAATTTAAPSIALSFVNAAGAPASSVTASSPLTARALVQDPTGKPIANALVAFSTDNTLAVFTPSAGTTLTDATGLATVTLKPASLSASGAGKVAASVTVSGTTVVGEQNYVVGATALSLSALTLSPSSIPAYGSTVLTLDVMAGAAKYTDQQLTVNFTSSCVTAGKATLAAKVPTNNGSVQAVYRDQGCGNNDTISAAVDGVNKPATAVLTIAVPAAASIQFETATPTDRSIVIKGQGGITRTETATLKFRVFDTFGNALPGKNVTFTTVSAATDVVINKIHDSTDANGEVITTVNSGSNPNTFRITATIDGTVPAISTTSDSIVVTTGVLVQKAFSLSVGADNVEGWAYDSGPTTPATSVNLLIADLAGNPVADGTPAIFQSNMGSVGSSSKGACNTVNGGCSVDFRTQDPRLPLKNSPATPCNKFGVGGADALRSYDDSTRTGLATICASSTDGTTTIFKKIGLFMSGSVASNVYLYTGLGPVKITSDPLQPVTDLGSVGAYESRVFNLLVSDVNLNPMPFGTKVEIASIINGAPIGVGPPTVPNIFPHGAGADYVDGTPVSATLDSNQGSIHTVTIGSSQPKPCSGPLIATFNIAITTPAFSTRPQTTTSYPFKVTFTCP